MAIVVFSFTNLVATATVAGSSEDENWPATFAREAHRPFEPWRTAGLGEQSLVVDLGSTPTDPLLLVIARANFTAVTVQGNATDSWGSPSFSEARTIRQSWLNDRYQHAMELSGFPRYLRLLIADQTPTDGRAYYILGGLWAGPIVRTPRNILSEVAYPAIDPVMDVTPDNHEGWRQRLQMADLVGRISLTRLARTTRRIPGSQQDRLQQWAEQVDRAARQAGAFAIALDPVTDPSQAWIMRRLNPPGWTMIRPRFASDAMELEEAVGP